jgi:hypothetical protein
VPVTLTFDGVAAATAGGAPSFTYTASPTVQSVYPSVGVVDGGAAVIVTGQGWTNVVRSGRVACLFGATDVPATVVDDTRVACVTPLASAEGTVPVTVQVNGTYRVPGAATFAYQMPAVVVAVVPSVGSTAGGVSVVVYGISLGQTTAATSCRRRRWPPTTAQRAGGAEGR